MGLTPTGQVRRRVGVPVGGVSALTGEHSVSQGEISPNGSAGRAELAGWIPAVSDRDLSAAPCLLVDQLAGELGPAGIRYGTCQAVVGQHPGHMQTLDDEPVVSLDQLVGDLVGEMPA